MFAGWGADVFRSLQLTTLMVVLGDQFHTVTWQTGLFFFVVGLMLWFATRRLFAQRKKGQAETPNVPEKSA